MKLKDLGLGEGEFVFKINLTLYNVLVGSLLWLYFIFMNASKGYFFSSEGLLGVIGTATDVGIRYFFAIPMAIIDIVPLIAVMVLIVFHFMNKPIKKLFKSIFIILLMCHLAYIPFNVIGFNNSVPFTLAGIILAILGVYLFVVNEEKRKDKKALIHYDIPVKMAKYNMVMGLLLILFTVMVIIMPFLSTSSEANAAIDIFSAAGSLNSSLEEVTTTMTKQKENGLALLNLPILLLKLPFVMVSLLTLYKMYKNRTQAFVMPKMVFVLGLLTFLGLPFLLSRLKLDEILAVNSSVKIMGYLLLSWFLFEMVFVREIDQSIKRMGSEGLQKMGAFKGIVQRSHFSQKAIIDVIAKIPFIGKKVMAVVKIDTSKFTEVLKQKNDKSAPVLQKKESIENVVVDIKKSYFIKSPLVILEGLKLAVNKEAETLGLYIQLKHDHPEVLSAIVLDIDLKDILGNVLEKIEGLQVLDLNIARGVKSPWLKVQMDTAHISARKIEVHLRNSVFEGDLIYSYSEENTLQPYPVRTLLISDQVNENSLRKYFEKMTLLDPERLTYLPVMIEEVWICACSSHNETKVCSGCGNAKETIFETVTLQHIHEFIHDEEETMREEERLKKEKRDETLSAIKANSIQKKNQALSKLTQIGTLFKTNEKLRKGIILGTVSIVLAGSLLTWASARPLTDEKATSLYYQAAELAHPENMTFTKKTRKNMAEYTITVTDVFESYQVDKVDEVTYKKNGIGMWKIVKINERQERLKPRLGADAKVDDTDITAYLKAFCNDENGIVTIQYPEPVAYSSVDQTIPLEVELSGERGTYTGKLSLEYGYEDNAWHLKAIDAVQNDFVFSPLEPLTQDTANVDLTGSIGDFDYVVEDTFKTSNGMDAVVAIRGTFDSQLFNSDYTLETSNRKMGEIVVFDKMGNLVNYDPTFSLLESGTGIPKEMDILYNDYEPGINQYHTREIFKITVDGNTFLCIKEVYEWSHFLEYSLAMFELDSTYTFRESHLLSAYRIDEGGTITESMGTIDGVDMLYEDIVSIITDIRPEEGALNVVIKSDPFYHQYGGTWVEVK